MNASATSPARGSAHTYGNTTSDTYPDASTRNGNTAANGHKVGATVTFASTGTATGASGTHGPPSELHHESEAEDSANEAEVGDNNDDIEALSSLMDQELAGTDVSTAVSIFLAHVNTNIRVLIILWCERMYLGPRVTCCCSLHIHTGGPNLHTGGSGRWSGPTCPHRPHQPIGTN